MNSVKGIIFLELLYKQSSVNKEKLLNLFVNMVNETDIYKRLEDILNSNIFIGMEAVDLHKRANELLNEARINPQKAINVFFKIEELVLILERKKHESEVALAETDFFSVKPSVVSKTLAATSTKFYEEFYKSLTYFTIILFGLEGITKWSALPIGSFTDLIGFVDNILSKKMKEIKSTKGKWTVVEKYYAGGKAGVSYNGCELLYENTEEIIYIGTHKHPYIRIGSINDKKFVEGYGYITGVNLNDVNSLFEGELVKEVNISNITVDPLVIDSNILNNPVEFLSKVLGTNKFILSPEAYVKLLNKYFINHTILERKNSLKCLLCGRNIDPVTNDICQNHFDYTQN